MMRELSHNGVLIPRYDWKKLRLTVKGVEMELAPEQEEMAVAWVRKLGTNYVNDKRFVRSFLKDFCTALNLKERLGLEAFDFSIVQGHVEKEVMAKLNLPKEARKKITEQRKALRELNKERYGYAFVDGVKTEIGKYTAEPSCIFMGRGKHPLRGRWKQGPKEQDITLNLSPNVPRPAGNWKQIVWEPDVMWIARWKDKLQGKMKHVWLSDSSLFKQQKDIEKFNKARDLQKNLERTQTHIWENLDADDVRRRKTATVCYLIDKLKIRVGDEKDPDEADTVGAATLRPEHVRFDQDGKVIFSFLGKDSVPHVFEEVLPEAVVRNLKEFSVNTKSTLFFGVDSKRVSEFLDEVISGLSAKVFRTCYATRAVETKLFSTPVGREAPDHVKKHVAAMANLEAAKVCNHRRTIPKTWGSSLRRQEDRLRQLVKRSREFQEGIRDKIDRAKEMYAERLRKEGKQLKVLEDRPQLAEKIDGGNTALLRKRIGRMQEAITVRRERIRRLRNERAERVRKLEARLEMQRQSDRAKIEKATLQVETKKRTRDYNLTTSLKSYIDPRVYYAWGKKVGYDWRLYYPETLQRKFSWVETDVGKSEGK